MTTEQENVFKLGNKLEVGKKGDVERQQNQITGTLASHE